MGEKNSLQRNRVRRIQLMKIRKVKVREKVLTTQRITQRKVTKVREKTLTAQRIAQRLCYSSVRYSSWLCSNSCPGVRQRRRRRGQKDAHGDSHWECREDTD